MNQNKNNSKCLPGVSTVSVLTPAISHSPPLLPQEALQCLQTSLWTFCETCVGNSDSNLALFPHAFAPKVHSCPSQIVFICGNTHCPFIYTIDTRSTQFSLVAESCPTCCDPMGCSTTCFPVHYQLLELAQTHVH